MMKRSYLRSMALIAALAGLGALGFVIRRAVLPAGSMPEKPAPQMARAAHRLVLAPCQLGEGIYMAGHLSPAAVYVVETSDGLVMIDTGLEQEYDKIVTAMAGWKLDLKRLKMILLTHVHGDHSMGAARLRRETGAKIYIGREDAKALREGGPWEAIFSQFDMPGVTAHPTEVDGELIDGQVLTLGGARITVIATPGHTLGSVCYLIEHRDSTMLFTGDTVMSLADGLGTYSTYLAPRFRGDTASYLASLKKLRELPVPDMVLPGHPESDPLPQDPHLSQREWQMLLDRGIQELEQLAEQYARDGADFIDGHPKQLAEGLFYLGDMAQRPAYALVRDDATFLFDAIGDPDVAAFLTSAWQKLRVEPPPIKALLLTSCRPQQTVGLESLVKATGCQVAASPVGVGDLEQRLPDARILTSDDLTSLDCGDLQAITTQGTDPTGVSYRFTIGEDLVLVTGDLPLERTEAELRQMLSDGTVERWDLAAIKTSLNGMEFLRPALWLSAHPLRGRNANLYGGQWLEALRKNRKLLRQLKPIKR